MNSKLKLGAAIVSRVELRKHRRVTAGSRWYHPLVGRFQRCRWSDTRKRIDALEIGESVTVPATEFNNATTTIQRLQEAYEGTRRWRMKKVAAGWRVERVAPNEKAHTRPEL